MTAGGVHLIVGTQKFFNCLDFRRRLYNNQIFCHNRPLYNLPNVILIHWLQDHSLHFQI